VFSFHAAYFLDAGFDRLAIDDDGAGAAGTFTAAVFYGFETQIIAKDIDETALASRMDFLPIDP
jgi:hypothetical protein